MQLIESGGPLHFFPFLTAGIQSTSMLLTTVGIAFFKWSRLLVRLGHGSKAAYNVRSIHMSTKRCFTPSVTFTQSLPDEYVKTDGIIMPQIVWGVTDF